MIIINFYFSVENNRIKAILILPNSCNNDFFQLHELYVIFNARVLQPFIGINHCISRRNTVVIYCVSFIWIMICRKYRYIG